MYFESSQLRDAANKYAKQTRDFLNAHSQDVQDNTSKLSKYIRAHYPDMLSQARDVAGRGVSQTKDMLSSTKGVLNSAGGNVYSMASGVGKSMRHAESTALKLGIGYVIVRLFSSPENKLSESMDKVKERMQEKPVESALIALGAGYLLGKLLR